MQNKNTFLIFIMMLFLLAACVLPGENSSNGGEVPIAGAQDTGSAPGGDTSGTSASISPDAATATAAAIAALTGTPGILTPSLKPADAESPTAGICAEPPAGEFVVMTIRPDVPDPRCAIARRDQQLVLVNATVSPIEASLGIFNAIIQPGEEGRLDMALGEYLAPGVHFIQVSPPGMGGELLLLDK